MNRQGKPTKAAKVAPLNFNDCPDREKGGEFIYDPETGARKRAGQGDQAPAAALQAVAPGQVATDANTTQDTAPGSAKLNKPVKEDKRG